MTKIEKIIDVYNSVPNNFKNITWFVKCAVVTLMLSTNPVDAFPKIHIKNPTPKTTKTTKKIIPKTTIKTPKTTSKTTSKTKEQIAEDKKI